MKSFIRRYHLNIGVLLAIVLPGIFVFQETVPERMLIRFVSSSLFIISLWTANFMLVDFTRPTGPPYAPSWYLRVVLAFLITTIAYVVIGFLIDDTGTMLSQVRGANITSAKSWFFLSVRLLLLNGLVLIIKYMFDSDRERRRIELENISLKKDSLAALHEVLKQQLKPHFLFNSLNTIKTLIKSDPDMAEHFITELSSMYRYMLKHQSNDVVLLKEEVNFAVSYLYLLSIRYGGAICTEIDVSDRWLENVIPPNTLQLLIENAVKHNALSQTRPLKIQFYVDDSFLVVQNNLQPKNVSEHSSSLGLKNICNRYRLLFNREVIIQQTSAHFKVSLPLSNSYGHHHH